MTNRIKNRLLFALVLALAALVCLGGCGKEPAQEIAIEQQGTPDIFIEEAQQLSGQSTPPNLMIETVSGEIATATTATLGGYVWEWVDEKGSVRLSEEEAPCAADMKTIVTVPRGSSDGTAKLQFSGGTLRSVQIWADGAPMEEGEKLTIEGGRIVFPESGAWRYEIVVEYPGGRVYYAFRVSE